VNTPTNNQPASGAADRLVVTTRDLFTIPGFSTRRGFCRGRSGEWAKRHGIDWKDFKRNGIDADVLLATGDGFALALVEWARKRREAGDGR
jgi:hypothetical protein